jgi:hypothetical protein
MAKDRQGNGPVYVKSGKQKIVTRSSTEAELVGISDALSQILWCREYLLSFGLDLGPETIFQDNMSTIFLANKGRSTSESSRHIKIRYFFVAHYIENKKIMLQYMPTGEMIADIHQAIAWSPVHQVRRIDYWKHWTTPPQQ